MPIGQPGHFTILNLGARMRDLHCRRRSWDPSHGVFFALLVEIFESAVRG